MLTTTQAVEAGALARPALGAGERTRLHGTSRDEPNRSTIRWPRACAAEPPPTGNTETAPNPRKAEAGRAPAAPPKNHSPPVPRTTRTRFVFQANTEGKKSHYFARSSDAFHLTHVLKDTISLYCSCFYSTKSRHNTRSSDVTAQQPKFKLSEMFSTKFYWNKRTGQVLPNTPTPEAGASAPVFTLVRQRISLGRVSGPRGPQLLT